MDTEIHTIYTIGYAGWTPAGVKAKVEALGAVLLDIRYSPWSKRPEWKGEALRLLLGRAHYSHIKTLGNRNYRGDGPIVLDAPEAAIETVTRLLEHTPIVLLCACRDAEQCHRSVAADFLSERIEGAAVVHLYPDTQHLELTEAQLASAAHAWGMGSAALGAWAARNGCIRKYPQLVQLVREYTHDTTDYSQENNYESR